MTLEANRNAAHADQPSCACGRALARRENFGGFAPLLGAYEMGADAFSF